MFPGITKLTTLGEPVVDGRRVRERGDFETEDNLIEPSFTDQVNTPLDFMSTLPMIFNFKEGLSLGLGDTSSLNTGARDSRMTIWIDFSQLLRSFPSLVRPRIVTLNKSPDPTESFGREELIEMLTLDKDEVKGEKRRESQLP